MVAIEIQIKKAVRKDCSKATINHIFNLEIIQTYEDQKMVKEYYFQKKQPESCDKTPNSPQSETI